MKPIFFSFAVLLLPFIASAASLEFQAKGSVVSYYFGQPIARQAAEAQLFANAQSICEAKFPDGGVLAIRLSAIRTVVTATDAAATAKFRCALPGAK